MVFYFESNLISPVVKIYMGKDKYENEDLIRWGWPEDIWFHVKNYSSAHVYLRLEKEHEIDKIPQSILEDTAQLVKANSIQASKLNNIDVIYTPWNNLKKTAGMAVGEVGFVNDNEVRTIRVEKKINEVVNRLNKTKKEEYPDLQEERTLRDSLKIREAKQRMKAEKIKEKEKIKELERLKDEMSYKSIFKPENMRTNKSDGNESDDFM